MPDVTYIESRILEVVDAYESDLRRETVTARRLDGPPLSEKETAGHLLWVCGEIRREIREGGPGNLGRCDGHLNFIRGALWAQGMCNPVH